jgi:hypothetical protein
VSVFQCSSSNNDNEVMTVTNVTLVTNFDLYEMHMHPNVTSECHGVKNMGGTMYSGIAPSQSCFISSSISFQLRVTYVFLIHTLEQNLRIVFSFMLTELFNKLLARERSRQKKDYNGHAHVWTVIHAG